MKNFAIIQYRPGSHGARNLEAELRDRGHSVRRINRTNVSWEYYYNGARRKTLVINWGCQEGVANAHIMSSMSPFNNYIVNQQTTSANKLFFMRNFSNVVPHFWETKIPAKSWLASNPNNKLVCRHKLYASGGEGIEIISHANWEHVPDAKLYVQYIPKKQEFRAHFSKYTNEIVYQQKKLRTAYEGPRNFEVRNLASGWVFCRENIVVPGVVQNIATDLKARMPLSFGAVDIIYNEYLNKAYALEVNTAPGLEGQTVKDYADFFEKGWDQLCNASGTIGLNNNSPVTLVVDPVATPQPPSNFSWASVANDQDSDF